MDPRLPVVVAGLAAAGLANAVLFLLVTTPRSRAAAPRLARACGVDDATCAVLATLPDARVLGVPNSVLGLAYYAALLGAGLLGVRDGAMPLCPVLVLAAAAAAAMSAYLAWALLRKLRVRCALCFVGHGVNAALLLAVLAACA